MNIPSGMQRDALRASRPGAEQSGRREKSFQKPRKSKGIYHQTECASGECMKTVHKVCVCVCVCIYKHVCMHVFKQK